MALSDRIALLRNGALEQIASPREIYSRPATAYTAEFIGQTNLLRGEIKNGIARCGSLQWETSEASGAVIFSLRPEAIRIAEAGDNSAGAVHFRGTIRQQVYSGASELLEIDCGGNQTLRARVPASGPLSGEHEFAFAGSEAVLVRDSAAVDAPHLADVGSR